MTLERPEIYAEPLSFYNVQPRGLISEAGSTKQPMSLSLKTANSSCPGAGAISAHGHFESATEERRKMNIISQYARGVIDETTFTAQIEAMSITDLQQLLSDNMAAIFTESIMGERNDGRRVFEYKALKILAEVVKSRLENS